MGPLGFFTIRWLVLRTVSGERVSSENCTTVYDLALGITVSLPPHSIRKTVTTLSQVEREGTKMPLLDGGRSMSQ